MIQGIDYGISTPVERRFENITIPVMSLCEQGDCDEIGVLWVLVPSYTLRARVGGLVPIAARNVMVCVEHFIEFMWH